MHLHITWWEDFFYENHRFIYDQATGIDKEKRNIEKENANNQQLSDSMPLSPSHVIQLFVWSWLIYSSFTRFSVRQGHGRWRGQAKRLHFTEWNPISYPVQSEVSRDKKAFEGRLNAAHAFCWVSSMLNFMLELHNSVRAQWFVFEIEPFFEKGHFYCCL